MLTRKMLVIASIALVAVLAVAVSPITVAFAQESTETTHSYADDKVYDGKDGKSCPSKNQSEMSA
jgi:hypothetical protein